LDDVSKQISRLLIEVNEHKLIAFKKVNIAIQDRIQSLIDRYGALNTKFIPKKRHVKIEITRSMHQKPKFYIDLENLPRPMVFNGTTKMYQLTQNPHLQVFMNQVGPQRYANIESTLENPAISEDKITVRTMNARKLAV